MIVKQLGNTGIRLSVIGLGAWAYGGGGYRYGWGEQDDRESIAAIRRALELGINWIDTAPVYGDGRSEKIVGQAIKGVRDSVFISTKCGLWMDEKKQDLVTNLKKDSIRAEVEESLKRLQIDEIDLYQLHDAANDFENLEAWDVLDDLKKEGKIRYVGVSNFTLEQLRHVHAMHPVSFIQPEYHMLERSIEESLLDYCTASNIGIVAYSPMCRGLLTGKFTKERVRGLPPDDNRLTSELFREPLLSANLRLIERLRPIAQRNNKTMAQLAIAWVSNRPGITSAIVGARSPAQIEQTIPAGDWLLTGEDHAEIDKILDAHHARLKKLDTPLFAFFL